MTNSQFKEGDIVRIKDSSRFYVQGDTENPTNTSGKIHTIASYGSLPISVKWENNTQNSYNPEDLELLPQTQELKLEDVYTHAPFPELNQAINVRAKSLGIPEGVWGQADLTTFPYRYYDGEGVNESKTLPVGKQEVTIPVFLEMLTAFANRKKEVKVQLNSNVTATVLQEEGQVKIEYPGQARFHLTFQQLLDFQQSLKAEPTGITFPPETCVKFPTKAVGQALMDYAISKGLVVASNGDKVVKETDTYIRNGLLDYMWSSTVEDDNVITIDEFLKGLEAPNAPTPLPKLAGYEVTKTKEGILKVGCQEVELERFEALMEAITNQ